MGLEYDPAWYSGRSGKRIRNFNPNTSTRRLIRVHRRFRGRCQECGCETLVPYLASRWGWRFVENDQHFLTDGRGQVVAVASVQHILPRSEGGTNDDGNLTLFCRWCNNVDNELVMRMKRAMREETQPEVGDDRDPES